LTHISHKHSSSSNLSRVYIVGQSVLAAHAIIVKTVMTLVIVMYYTCGRCTEFAVSFRAKAQKYGVYKSAKDILKTYIIIPSSIRSGHTTASAQGVGRVWHAGQGWRSVLVPAINIQTPPPPLPPTVDQQHHSYPPPSGYNNM